MTNRRRGFTLVEIMVSMALTIFILTILAQAFVMGTDMFSTLKAVGDLNDSLRTAVTTLRADLSADHFGDKRRLSDSKFYLPPNDGPPRQGYFFLDLPQTSQFDVSEGNDPDGLSSRRRTGHLISGTAKTRGNRTQDFYSALDPAGKLAGIGSPEARFQQPGTFSSQWIEFCYFMKPIPFSAGGTQLFALYRQQRLVVADVDQLNWGAAKVQRGASDAMLKAYQRVVSCQPNPNPTFGTYIYFNSPADLTIPERRTATFTPFVDASGQPTGEDLLLTDVMSFDVQVLLSNSPGQFTDPAGRRYDTWSQRDDDVYKYSQYATIPPTQQPPYTFSGANILALQITLRVWDSKSKITRQITLIQDM